MVLPGFPCTSKEIDQALDLMNEVGLIQRYEVDGKKYICVNPETFYRHQSYIQQKKRKDDSGSRYPRPEGPWGEYFADGSDDEQETPQNTAEHQTTQTNTEERRTSPQNTASPSPTPSPSPSKDSRGGDIRAREGKLFKVFEENFLLSPNSTQRERLGTYLDDGMEPELIEKAILITRENGKDLNYLWGILNRLYERGIKTVESYEYHEAERRKRRDGLNGTHSANPRGDPGTGSEDETTGYYTSIPGLIKSI
jgi:DnaD/phage-associated family protein